MILELTKLFPNSCKLQGIATFNLNVDDITILERVIPENFDFNGSEISEDVIEVGNTKFRFPAIDDGIFVLHSIRLAKKFIDEYSNNKNSLLDNRSSKIERMLSEQYLHECSIKYCIDI